jgi:hypothetical protein
MWRPRLLATTVLIILLAGCCWPSQLADGAGPSLALGTSAPTSKPAPTGAPAPTGKPATSGKPTTSGRPATSSKPAASDTPTPAGKLEVPEELDLEMLAAMSPEDQVVLLDNYEMPLEKRRKLNAANGISPTLENNQIPNSRSMLKKWVDFDFLECFSIVFFGDWIYYDYDTFPKYCCLIDLFRFIPHCKPKPIEPEPPASTTTSTTTTTTSTTSTTTSTTTTAAPASTSQTPPMKTTSTQAPQPSEAFGMKRRKPKIRNRRSTNRSSQRPAGVPS